ncbi:low temperature-induced protein [Phormidium sp. LEGE 05292]|uniref:low temperature-induced protein n=1 Tax=[Phormidium] sp. LEGE 05292 TaxID=767427 RepID=UPI0018811483|nr:low temperature-induced protein [Phormidium sp. LEGE 05292]MBE9228992.1 low temperature-induced protein [Phormidium sp. LEGE 05292]
MCFINFNLSNLVRRFRFFVAACVCVLLVMSYTLPAYSATSKPTEGEANLLEIEGKSQDAISSKDPSDFGLHKQVKETNPGLNEIQGTADADKMKRPENTSKNTKSVEQIIGNSLEKVTGEK